jgi:hypothetical protein
MLPTDHREDDRLDKNEDLRKALALVTRDTEILEYAETTKAVQALEPS